MNTSKAFMNLVVMLSLFACFTGCNGSSALPLPPAPTGVTATPGSGRALIAWSTVSGATSYNIYWSTAPGVTTANGTKISGVASPYTHTGLTNGTTYYYVVTVISAGLESAASSQVSATPAPPAQMGGAIQGSWLSLSAAVATIAGTAGTSGSADGTGAAARFNAPNGITTDGTSLYVADSGNNMIRKIVIASGAVTTLAGTAGASGSADGTGAAARFNTPQGITTDGTNLFVVDTGNNTIRKIVIASGAVTTLAGTAGTSGSADGIGAAAQFNNPQSITTDNTNLYVTDRSNSTIRKIASSSGTVTTIAVIPTPQGITTDGTNLFVTGPQGFYKMSISSGIVTRSSDTTFSPPNDSLAVPVGLAGITTDGINLYVAISNVQGLNHYVLGTAVPATSFSDPRGVITDGKSLFVTDIGSNIVIKIN